MAEIIDIAEVMKEAGGYSPRAARFLRDGLAHTVERVHGRSEESLEELEPSDEERYHVSGQQLCLGLRDFALEQYGMLARQVLGSWGVTRTDDFGKIVFALVEAGVMRKTERDTIEDFRGVFDFAEEFSEPVGEPRAGS